MLKIVAFAVAVLLAGVLLLAAAKPDTFRVQRSARIQAPPAKVYALIEDFQRWGAWSPYEKLDPAMKREIGGTPKGKGAFYAWESQGKAGVGRMEILEASPHSDVRIRLDFVKPFPASNVAEFRLKPSAGATEVTWEMHGPAPFMSKVMQVFFNIDRMVGSDFEAGLANLKGLAENS